MERSRDRRGRGGGGDKWYDINFYSYRIRHDLITISFENRFGTIPDNRVLSNWIGGLHGAGGTERERERWLFIFMKADPAKNFAISAACRRVTWWNGTINKSILLIIIV